MNKDAVAEMSQRYQIEAAEKVVPEGYKQTEVGVIPEDWECKSLGDICGLKSGLSITSKDIDDASRYPCFGGNGLRGYTENYTHDGEFALIGRQGALCGNVQHVAGKFFASEHALVASPARSIESAWLATYLARMNLNQYSESSAQPGLSAEKLKVLKLIVPALKDQKAIAKALFDTDALLSELEKLIAKKQAIKTATMQQLLTGRTRLPQFDHHPDGSKKGYRQSELGEIPEDWEVIQLGEIATFIKGAGLPKSDLIDSGKNRCIHYGQLFTTYGPKIEKILSSTDIDGSIKSEINDILMPTSDVTPNGLATASCILESGIVLGGDILIIRSKKELLDGVFFAYLITVMRDQVMQLVTGSTVYHLYGSDMAKFLFAKPVFEEQTTIATILSDMDKEIQALEQRLNKTRQIKQGMMQQLLTGKVRLV
ncbi:MAG: restriction endonuclease subunit S [Pseudomonas sp.]|nr:restriction endonuclease subunit S [Pseudomonas sp.]